MRLLRYSATGDITLAQFSDEDIPPYAILSHTWGPDAEEVTFEDLTNNTGKDKPGYVKIRFCGEQARQDGLQYFWIDTCCIDKRSSAELSEAINSMYRWYEDANVCYAYLADVPSKAKFPDSRWFTRGWTLQELIAPSTVIFFDEEWKTLGTKQGLQQDVSSCTGIPVDILSGDDDLETYSVAQRMSWAAKRKTSRIEDRAYCLLGIFGINMPLIYGERETAFIRLQEEIMRISEDHSLFAWRDYDNRGGLLALSPASFTGSCNIVQYNPFDTFNSPLAVSSRGIHLEVRFIGRGRQRLGLAILHCKERGKEEKLVAIYVRDLDWTMERFERVNSEEFEHLDLSKFRPSQYPVRKICVQVGRTTRMRKSKALQKCDSILPEMHSNITLSNLVDFGVGRSLFRAAKEGDRDMVWLLLTRSDVMADLKDGTGRKALAHAVLRGDNVVAKMLLAGRDADTESKDETGRTLLSWAAEKGHEAVVKLLLDKGANLKAKDIYSRTPLGWAAQNGHEAVVKLLLDKGANLEARDVNSRTPLGWAAQNGHEAVVKLLLDKGANLEARDIYGRIPLGWAAQNRHEAVVKLLLDKGADLEARDEYDLTPLGWAV